MKLQHLAEVLGHKFTAERHLRQALTHPSFGAENNQRLEFLGDSILNLVIAAELFARFGDLNEGALSRLRANLVRQDTLAKIAQSVALGAHLYLGEGEKRAGGSARASNLADAIEAIIGAAYLDGGFDAARKVTLTLYRSALAAVDPTDVGKDPKTVLQEMLMAKKMALPVYELKATRGASHRQEFDVTCAVRELDICCTGSGANRRAAEQCAARAVLEQIRKNTP